MTSVFYFTFVRNIIIYINILKMNLINTGFSMSIIERFKNWSVFGEVSERGPFISGKKTVTPNFYFIFLVRQLIIDT